MNIYKPKSVWLAFSLGFALLNLFIFNVFYENIVCVDCDYKSIHQRRYLLTGLMLEGGKPDQANDGYDFVHHHDLWHLYNV